MDITLSDQDLSGLNDSSAAAIRTKARYSLYPQILNTLVCEVQAWRRENPTKEFVPGLNTICPRIEPPKPEVNRHYWIRHKDDGLDDWHMAICIISHSNPSGLGFAICGDELVQDPANFHVRFPAIEKPQVVGRGPK